MKFGTNKTPIEVIKEGEIGRTYLADIYSGINGKWYKKSWKGLDELKDIDQNYYFSNHYEVNINKYKTKCGTSIRFWKNKC